ncbi:MAG: thymidylate synthase (FAD) [Methylococcaceae bacterium TMED69]|nr:MAG: thymidylate synthase (FAD) [Methylococcaceae bacterium TMED69]|tara:strand:+ start:1512 stop:2195 length:684 start_codon:yes stop_codon:yes gene_type:complete
MKIDLYGDGIGCVEYIQHMGEDITVVNAARVSFGKHKKVMDEKDEKLVKYLIRHKHTSTLEHNVATFRFVVPLFVRSQHHRHRTWSYNEISRRYTAENLRFYEPDIFRTQHKSNRQASNNDITNPVLSCGSDCDEAVSLHHQMSVDLYNKMLESGVCREQARGVLPQNMYTEYYGTCNLNNLIKFVVLRSHEGAQWEIQKVAQACLSIVEPLWPTAIAKFREIKNIE